MRRLLAIFLLMLMPLQFSWAAVGAYCEHETGAAAQHFGHHDHRHQADEPGSDGSEGKLLSFHADCGQCHGAGATILPAQPTLTVSHLAQGVVPWTRDGAIAPVLAPPERPNWAALA